MIVGLILAGTVLGAVAASIALVLGQSIWMALLIYSGAGTIGVLAGAFIAAVRGKPVEKAQTVPETPAQPQRG